MESTAFNAFGWVVDRYTFAQGEQYCIELRKDTPKQQLANRTFYVRGAATGVSDNPNYQPPARYPGFFYTDMPDVVLAAKTVYTATEPLEWWCINWHQNNKAFPEVEKFVKAAGEVAQVSARLFLCRGSVQVGSKTYEAPCEVPVGELTVTQDAYGILFA